MFSSIIVALNSHAYTSSNPIREVLCPINENLRRLRTVGNEPRFQQYLDDNRNKLLDVLASVGVGFALTVASHAGPQQGVI